MNQSNVLCYLSAHPKIQMREKYWFTFKKKFPFLNLKEPLKYAFRHIYHSQLLGMIEKKLISINPNKELIVFT